METGCRVGISHHRASGCGWIELEAVVSCVVAMLTGLFHSAVDGDKRRTTRSSAPPPPESEPNGAAEAVCNEV